jgi:hypothetical protein
MELRKQDLQHVVARLPKDVIALIKERNLFLGGGFVRATIAGEKPADIDLFGSTKDQLEASARALSDQRHGARMHSSKNALTVLSGSRMPVQMIFRWLYSLPEDLMKSFDFTVAQAIIWYAKNENGDGGLWHSCCHDDFYPDLAARRLVYCSPFRNEDAGGSILRVRKFLARGYNIQAPALAAVIARLCSAVEWGSIGDEENAAFVLCGLLREVDPMVAVDGIDFVDEHEVIKGGA